MKVKNQRKETGEKGEENASLSRNVDSSLYLQYLCFLLIFINALDMAVCSLARIFSICFARFSTTIEKSVEIRLYSPRLYVTFVRIYYLEA